MLGCGRPLETIGAASGSQRMIFGVRALVGEDAGDAFEGASSAEAGDPVVELGTFEVAEDLLRGGTGVEVGVGLVGELAGEEPTVFGCEFFCLFDHAGAAYGAGVMTTLAPRKRMSLRRSMEKVSAMVTTRG